jgi:hypothetical protein
MDTFFSFLNFGPNCFFVIVVVVVVVVIAAAVVVVVAIVVVSGVGSGSHVSDEVLYRDFQY